MAEATVVNPHTHDCEEGSFKSIDMVHALDVLSRDSVQLTLARTKLGSKLAKSRQKPEFRRKNSSNTHTTAPISLNTTAVAFVFIPPYIRTNAHHDKSGVRLFPVT